MFQYKWMRLFVRRRTKPIPEKTAVDWKKRLSLGYMLLAWNAFGFVGYMMFTGRADWAKYYGLKKDEEEITPGVYWAKAFHKKEAKIIKLSGLQIVGEETYKPSPTEANPNEEPATSN